MKLQLWKHHENISIAQLNFSAVTRKTGTKPFTGRLTYPQPTSSCTAKGLSSTHSHSYCHQKARFVRVHSTYMALYGGRDCLLWSAGAHGPPTLSGTADWGSDEGPYQQCLLSGKRQMKVQFKFILLWWKQLITCEGSVAHFPSCFCHNAGQKHTELSG